MESKFQFNQPQIYKISFMNNNLLTQENVNQTVTFRFSTDRKPISNSECFVLLTLDIKFSEEKQPLELSITMGARFNWDDSIEPSNSEHFLNTNAPSLLLSYIRPIVAALTSNSGFNPINIPFMDFTNGVNN